MSKAFAGMIEVIPLQDKGAENTIHGDGFPPFALFSQFGLVGSIDLIGCSLQQEGHQCASRLEDSRPN